MVAAVPMTPILLFRVARVAARAPGRITPAIGSSFSSSNAGRASALAVLHASTTALISRRRRKRIASRVKRVTVSGDFVP